MNITSSLFAGCLICMGTEQGAISKMLIKDDISQQIIVDQISTKSNNYSSYSKKYIRLIEELSSFSTLERNWDGYNGVKPDNEIISTVENFLTILKEKNISSPEIMLSGDGEIGLFWKNKKDYIEISFYTKDYLTFFHTLGSSFYGEDDILFSKNSPTKLYAALNHFQDELSSRETKSLTTGTKQQSNPLLIEVA